MDYHAICVKQNLEIIALRAEVERLRGLLGLVDSEVRDCCDCLKFQPDIQEKVSAALRGEEEDK